MTISSTWQRKEEASLKTLLSKDSGSVCAEFILINTSGPRETRGNTSYRGERYWGQGIRRQQYKVYKIIPPPPTG